jgi:hypothetical protein
METAGVRSALALTLVGAETPVLLTAELEYNVRDPYAVTAVFFAGERPVRWIFSRDLLDEGLVHDVGDGDVQVVPGTDDLGLHTIQLRLASPDGVAVLEAASDEVLDFLGRSYALVPPGTESTHLDVDAALEQMLGR